MDGELDGAIEAYDAAIQADAELSEAYNNRGLAYAHKAAYDRAIENYDAVIRLDPEAYATYNNRGNAYSGKGEYDQAISDYSIAIILNPEDAATPMATDAALISAPTPLTMPYRTAVRPSGLTLNSRQPTAIGVALSARWGMQKAQSRTAARPCFALGHDCQW